MLARTARSRIGSSGFRRGLRVGAPFAVAGFVLAVSFGILAEEAGFSAVAAVIFSAIVFAGSAQFTAVAIVDAGGGAGAAVAAATLMNSRFLPMSAAVGPWGSAEEGPEGPSRGRPLMGALVTRRRDL